MEHRNDFPPQRRRAARVPAFTLLETLVVVAIVAALMAMLIPALRAVRTSSKTIVCSANMKTMLMDFRLFAAGDSDGGRGDSEQLGHGRFWINDFQDRLYHLDEFWDRDAANVAALSTSEDPVLCPAGAPRLTKRRGFPCGRDAVRPVEDVSLALNMRLYRAVLKVKGKNLLTPPASTILDGRILDRPYVPLILDVDGGQAVARGVDPFYIAPPLSGVDDPYASGRYWSPADRHAGRTIVGFVGGHVLSSDQPGAEKWDWSYQGRLGR